MHYYRVKRGGTPEMSVRQQAALRVCSIVGCGEPHVANDLCDMHLARKRRHGDPNFINPKCNRDGGYIPRARIKSAAWKKDNPELNSTFNQARKTRERMSWEHEREAIRLFYEACPAGMAVDHILPINNKKVSGLHCLANLQYLPIEENSNKSNKFDGTYENESWRKKAA